MFERVETGVDGGGPATERARQVRTGRRGEGAGCARIESLRVRAMNEQRMGDEMNK